MQYVPRLVDSRLAQVFDVFPAVMVLGPRACGKTTTARRWAGITVELDDPPQAAPFRADPGAALRAALDRASRSGSRAVLLDEWQEVPEVLGAVKRVVDRGAPPGSLLLTGSVRASLESATWPGTGPVIHLDMHPMTVLERHGGGGVRSDLIDLVFDGDAAALPLSPDGPDLVGYVADALRGGYPPAVELDERSRRTWLDGYVDQLVLRDAPELAHTRDPAGLRRVLRALVGNTAGITADTAIAASADVNVKTAQRNERLLDDLHIVTSVPSWHSNRISRMVKARKRYVVDPGLGASVLGVDADAVMSHGGLLGRLIDTFVMAQLRPLLSLADRSIRAHHLRQQDGRHEVDVVLEAPDGRICGMEIKAGASPTRADARHLGWLRDAVGDRFAAGVVLHTGRSAYPLDDRITACPIAAFWGDATETGS